MNYLDPEDEVNRAVVTRPSNDDVNADAKKEEGEERVPYNVEIFAHNSS